MKSISVYLDKTKVLDFPDKKSSDVSKTQCVCHVISFDCAFQGSSL